jgi:hypothetical protein
MHQLRPLAPAPGGGPTRSKRQSVATRCVHGVCGYHTGAPCKTRVCLWRAPWAAPPCLPPLAASRDLWARAPPPPLPPPPRLRELVCRVVDRGGFVFGVELERRRGTDSHVSDSKGTAAGAGLRARIQAGVPGFVWGHVFTRIGSFSWAPVHGLVSAPAHAGHRSTPRPRAFPVGVDGSPAPRPGLPARARRPSPRATHGGTLPHWAVPTATAGRWKPRVFRTAGRGASGGGDAPEVGLQRPMTQ